LRPNNEIKIKLYDNLCNAINSEGFNIPLNQITLDNNTRYEKVISEINSCFKNSIQNEKSNQNEEYNEIEKI